MVKPPLDFRNPEFSKSFRGYDVEEVEEFFEELLECYETIYKENITLKEKIELNEGNMNHYKEMEETLKSTLVLAQKSADDMRKSAEREAEFLKTSSEKEAIEIIRKAQEKADHILKTAELDAKHILDQYTDLRKEAEAFRMKMRAQLLAQLDVYSNSHNKGNQTKPSSLPANEEVLSEEEIVALIGEGEAQTQAATLSAEFNPDEQATMVIPVIPRIR